MQRTTLLILALLALVSSVIALPRELVVVEVGTGTWCQYCPGAAMGCHDLLTNGHPVAIIKNHNGDSYANTYSNARNTYYGITGYPTARFDGLNPSVGGSATASLYSSYLPKVTSRMAVASHYTLSATGNQNGLNYNINVVVDKPEEDTNTNVVLHAVVTETNIPQVWFNQTHVDNVCRLMVPNQNGTPVNLATGGSVTIPLAFTTQAAWNVGNLELVIFLQNTTTKEILQGKKYPLAGLTGALPVSTSELSFPNMYVTGSTTLPIIITNFFDTPATGTLSSNNPVFTVNPGTFTVAGGQNTTVNVTFSPVAAQAYTGILTITSNLQNHPSIQVDLTGTGFLDTAPLAQNVTVTGPPVVYQNLSAAYTFYDADEDTEGTTTFQWYRMVNNQPQAIANAVTATYRAAVEDMGYPIVCGITPFDQHGMPGTLTMSAPTVPIEELPAPQNFTAVETEDNVVTCSWQRPHYFEGRGFVGYRVYRNGLLVNTITNPNNMSFVDTWVPDGTYEYWVVSLFNDPMMISNPSNVVTLVVGPSANDDDVLPAALTAKVGPNPFSGSTTLEISAKANQAVSVEIFNSRGQLVKNFALNTGSNGSINQVWNATDLSGNKVRSGMYHYRIKTADDTVSGRITLVK